MLSFLPVWATEGLSMSLCFSGVSAADEPDSVLHRGEQEAVSAGRPADRRSAPPAEQRRVQSAGPGTSDHQESVCRKYT